MAAILEILANILKESVEFEKLERSRREGIRLRHYGGMEKHFKPAKKLFEV